METLKAILEKNNASGYDLYVCTDGSTAALNLDMLDQDMYCIDSQTLIFFEIKGWSQERKDKLISKLYDLKESLEGLLCPLEAYVVGFLSVDEQDNPHVVISNRYYLTKEEAIAAMKITVKEKMEAGVRYAIATCEKHELSDNCEEYTFLNNILGTEPRFVLKKVKLLKR